MVNLTVFFSPFFFSDLSVLFILLNSSAVLFTCLFDLCFFFFVA